jgi:hypothetical protein
MNHAVIGKRLTKRFGNQGAKRIHKWVREQYSRVSQCGDNLSLTLDSVDTDEVYTSIERYIDCFHELKPADFVRWFRLMPVLDKFGRPKACVDVKAALYSDVFANAVNGEHKVKEVVLRGTDLIDLPSRSDKPIIQQRPINAMEPATGAVVSISMADKTASLFLPEDEVKQIIEIYEQTRYRCNPLTTSEWSDVLIVACYRRLLSTAEAMPWVRAMTFDVTQSLDMLLELDSECYQQHEVKTDVRHPVNHKVIASAVSLLNPSDSCGDADAVRKAADAVRARLELPAEGFDYNREGSGGSSSDNKLIASNVVSLSQVRPDDGSEAEGAGEFSNLTWGSF